MTHRLHLHNLKPRTADTSGSCQTYDVECITVRADAKSVQCRVAFQQCWADATETPTAGLYELSLRWKLHAAERVFWYGSESEQQHPTAHIRTRVRLRASSSSLDSAVSSVSALSGSQVWQYVAIPYHSHPDPVTGYSLLVDRVFVPAWVLPHALTVSLEFDIPMPLARSGSVTLELPSVDEFWPAVVPAAMSERILYSHLRVDAYDIYAPNLADAQRVSLFGKIHQVGGVHVYHSSQPQHLGSWLRLRAALSEHRIPAQRLHVNSAVREAVARMMPDDKQRTAQRWLQQYPDECSVLAACDAFLQQHADGWIGFLAGDTRAPLRFLHEFERRLYDVVKWARWPQCDVLIWACGERVSLDVALAVCTHDLIPIYSPRVWPNDGAHAAFSLSAVGCRLFQAALRQMLAASDEKKQDMAEASAHLIERALRQTLEQLAGQDRVWACNPYLMLSGAAQVESAGQADHASADSVPREKNPSAVSIQQSVSAPSASSDQSDSRDATTTVPRPSVFYSRFCHGVYRAAATPWTAAMYRITVLVPVYDKHLSATVLLEALHSIACQTFSNVEVVLLVSDAIPACVNLEHTLAQQWRREWLDERGLSFRLLHHDGTAGSLVALARSALVQTSNGFVLFHLPDGRSEPSRLARQLAALLYATEGDAPRVSSCERGLHSNASQSRVFTGLSQAVSMQTNQYELCLYPTSVLQQSLARWSDRTVSDVAQLLRCLFVETAQRYADRTTRVVPEDVTTYAHLPFYACVPRKLFCML